MKNSLSDAVNQAIDNRLSAVHTALPGNVEKYDAATQLADIQPLIMRRYPDDSVESLPVVTNVPVIFPAGGAGGMLSFPIVQGDPVLLIFCEKSLDVWLSKGGNVDPLDRRKFDLSDGIAIPGLFSINNAGIADPDSVVLQDASGSKIKLNPDSSIELISGNGEKFTLVGDGAIVLESSGGAKLNLNADGKMALGNASEELIALIDELLTLLQGTTTLTMLGAQPFINLAAYTALQTRLATIKGSL